MQFCIAQQSGAGSVSFGSNHSLIGSTGAFSHANIDAKNSFSTGVGTSVTLHTHDRFVEIGLQLVAQLGVAQQMLDFVGLRFRCG